MSPIAKNDQTGIASPGRYAASTQTISALLTAGLSAAGAPAPRAARLAAIRKVTWERGCRAGAGAGKPTGWMAGVSSHTDFFSGSGGVAGATRAGENLAAAGCSHLALSTR